mmetsp:Transcript_22471/g.57217  ORF Transcript_22471/g.57217 Transcript_22471/m.57217 type:complete len:201 (-) Transcript_22471:437-1039(-)
MLGRGGQRERHRALAEVERGWSRRPLAGPERALLRHRRERRWNARERRRGRGARGRRRGAARHYHVPLLRRRLRLLANQLARGRVEAQVHDVGPRWESRLVLHDARARDRAHLDRGVGGGRRQHSLEQRALPSNPLQGPVLQRVEEAHAAQLADCRLLGLLERRGKDLEHAFKVTGYQQLRQTVSRSSREHLVAVACHGK